MQKHWKKIPQTRRGSKWKNLEIHNAFENANIAAESVKKITSQKPKKCLSNKNNFWKSYFKKKKKNFNYLFKICFSRNFIDFKNFKNSPRHFSYFFLKTIRLETILALWAEFFTPNSLIFPSEKFNRSWNEIIYFYADQPRNKFSKLTNPFWLVKHFLQVLVIHKKSVVCWVLFRIAFWPPH